MKPEPGFICTELFSRTCFVIIGNYRISDLHFRFAMMIVYYGAEKHGKDSRIRIRDKNIFHSILAQIKK